MCSYVHQEFKIPTRRELGATDERCDGRMPAQHKNSVIAMDRVFHLWPLSQVPPSTLALAVILAVETSERTLTLTFAY